MSETLLASATFVSLLCLRLGRGPLVLAISSLLHARAAIRCGGVCARLAVQTWRQRYTGCYEAVRREAGG